MHLNFLHLLKLKELTESQKFYFTKTKWTINLIPNYDHQLTDPEKKRKVVFGTDSCSMV